MVHYGSNIFCFMRMERKGGVAGGGRRLVRTGHIPGKLNRGWGAVPVVGSGMDAAGSHLGPSQGLIVRRRGENICKCIRRSGKASRRERVSEFSVGSPQLNVCVALRASGLARISHRRLDSPEFKVWRSRGGPGGPQDSRSGDRRYDFRQRARNAGSSGNGMAFPC